MKLQDAPLAAMAACMPAVTVLGRLRGFDAGGQPLVTGLAARPEQVLVARSTVRLHDAMVGRELVLCLHDADPSHPIVLGVIEPHPLGDGVPAPARSALVDGERQVIEAGREIVLRCGEASITLTRAGKVLIQGSYILSRSRGYNRIKGAAIDIN